VRDAWAAGLYWYTDLDEAKAAAKRENKPIVSLRMLGRLDADLSCANSRFFRTTLYPDPRVNSLLREKFIMHWSSERPVPVVTVDFGDGRTMKRTVTGNSIHYVLDSNGRPLDALPGLYSSAEFINFNNQWFDTLTGRLGYSWVPNWMISTEPVIRPWAWYMPMRMSRLSAMPSGRPMQFAPPAWPAMLSVSCTGCQPSVST